MVSSSTNRATRIGAILAGGASRRMGRPKAGLPWDTTQTFSAKIANTLQQVCDEVVVVGHGAGCPPALARVDDVVAGEGPLSGILGLLRYDQADSFVIVPCDMPCVEAALLTRLWRGDPRSEGACFTSDTDGESLAPLPLWLSRRARPSLEALWARGERRLLRFLASIDLDTHRLSRSEIQMLRNLNEPRDLEGLRHRA